MTPLSSAPEGGGPETEDEAPSGEPDPERSALVQALTEHLDGGVLASEVAAGDVWVRVDRSAWARAARACRDHLEMDYFCFLSGIDWLPNPGLSGRKVWDPGPGESEEEEEASGGVETGVAGGDTRFQVLARLYSTSRKLGITLKADLDESDPRLGSWVGVYRGADWHERETWEMFGFEFEGHPRLRHIYLPGEFEGHPLRKDFPLLSREVKPWPGLVDVEPLPGEGEGEGDGEGGDGE